MSFYTKQHVVRAILWDIFRITSHGIYFPSLAILKTSDGISIPSDIIGEKLKKSEKMSGEIQEQFQNSDTNSRESQKEMEQERKTTV